MYLKVSTLTMLGLLCATCATPEGRITSNAALQTDQGAISVSRTAGGKILVTELSINLPLASKPALIRQFDQSARTVGCANGSIPTRGLVFQKAGDRLYGLSISYNCP
jgi:hypothetical protein